MLVIRSRGGLKFVTRMILASLMTLFCCHISILVHADPLSVEERAIVKHVDDSLQEQLRLLEQLVNINSGTDNPDGVRMVGELLRPKFEELGFTVRWHELPDHMQHAGSLVATMNSPDMNSSAMNGDLMNRTMGRRLLLIGHLDTVFSPNSDFQHFTISADKKKAIGPGVIDDKGGVVTILFALKAIKNVVGLNGANITVVLSGDEELAARPTEISRKVLVEAAKQSDIALGFEFALFSDELVVGRRGLGEWFLSSSGRSGGHSSAIFQPEVGMGAIFEISRVLHGIERKLSAVPGLTVNPGIILGGQVASEEVASGSGTARGRKTIVAAQAIAHGDLRFLNAKQRDHAVNIMRDISKTPLPGTSSSLTFKDIMPPMEGSEANQRLLEQFSVISEKLGGPKLRAAVPESRGGADVSYIAKYVPAILDGLGPWGSGAHSATETLEINSLPVVTGRAALFIWQQISQASPHLS